MSDRSAGGLSDGHHAANRSPTQPGSLDSRHGEMVRRVPDPHCVDMCRALQQITNKLAP